MTWGYYDRDYAAPRRPKDGIKAQTQRGQFGKTWWASKWIAALERLIDSARLARGRSYARAGQVVKLDVGSAGATALVQGSRPSPYKVSIQFKQLADATWDKVVDAIAAEAIYAAKLLSGEMPTTIQEVFETAGASLFPAAKGDLETDCSCPDWANPCKHVAAVHYLLGERFDDDPFLIFEMRGRSKEAIITALRARRAAAASPTPSDEVAPETGGDENETVVPLEESLGSFWSVPAGILDTPMDFSAPPIDALPVKRLGPPAFWHSQPDFATLMEQAYRLIGAYALGVAMGEDEGAEAGDGLSEQDRERPSPPRSAQGRL